MSPKEYIEILERYGNEQSVDDTYIGRVEFEGFQFYRSRETSTGGQHHLEMGAYVYNGFIYRFSIYGFNQWYNWEYFYQLYKDKIKALEICNTKLWKQVYE